MNAKDYIEKNKAAIGKFTRGFSVDYIAETKINCHYRKRNSLGSHLLPIERKYGKALFYHPSDDTISAPPRLTNRGEVFSFLHEAGHANDERFESRHELAAEVFAWIWARSFVAKVHLRVFDEYAIGNLSTYFECYTGDEDSGLSRARKAYLAAVAGYERGSRVNVKA